MSRDDNYQYMPANIELFNYETPTCIDYSSINTSNKSTTNYSEQYHKEYKPANARLSSLFNRVFRLDKNVIIRNMLIVNILIYSIIFLLIAKFY